MLVRMPAPGSMPMPFFNAFSVLRLRNAPLSLANAL